MKKGIYGFTLVEILVSIIVAGILTGLAVSVFRTASQSYFHSRTLHDLTVSGNRVMEVMSDVVRSGSLAQASVCGGTSTRLTITNSVDSIEYQSNGGCLQTIFSLQNGVNNNGRIRKSFNLDCLGPLGAGLITDDNGKNAIDVQQLNFCVRKNVGFPESVDINMVLGPNKSLAPLLPQSPPIQVNLNSSVTQRNYNN